MNLYKKVQLAQGGIVTKLANLFIEYVLLTFLIPFVGKYFHWIGPLGRFDLVVAMSVCMCVYASVCLMSLFMWYI